MIRKVASYIAEDFRRSYRRSARHHRLVDAAPEMLRVLKLTRASLQQLPEDVRMTAFRPRQEDGELGSVMDLDALLNVDIENAIRKAEPA